MLPFVGAEPAMRDAQDRHLPIRVGNGPEQQGHAEAGNAFGWSDDA